MNSRSRWWTGRPGMLWYMGLQRVGHDWATELNLTELKWYQVRIVPPIGSPYVGYMGSHVSLSLHVKCTTRHFLWPSICFSSLHLLCNLLHIYLFFLLSFPSLECDLQKCRECWLFCLTISPACTCAVLRYLWNEWLKGLIASSSLPSPCIPHTPQDPCYSEHKCHTDTTES